MQTLDQLSQLLDTVPSVFCSGDSGVVLPTTGTTDTSLYVGLPEKYSEDPAVSSSSGEYLLRSDLNKLAKMASDELFFREIGGYHSFTDADIAQSGGGTHVAGITYSSKVYSRAPGYDESASSISYYAWFNDNNVVFTLTVIPTVTPTTPVYEKTGTGELTQLTGNASSILSSVMTYDSNAYTLSAFEDNEYFRWDYTDSTTSSTTSIYTKKSNPDTTTDIYVVNASGQKEVSQTRASAVTAGTLTFNSTSYEFSGLSDGMYAWQYENSGTVTRVFTGDLIPTTSSVFYAIDEIAFTQTGSVSSVTTVSDTVGYPKDVILEYLRGGVTAKAALFSVKSLVSSNKEDYTISAKTILSEETWKVVEPDKVLTDSLLKAQVDWCGGSDSAASVGGYYSFGTQASPCGVFTSSSNGKVSGSGCAGVIMAIMDDEEEVSGS